MKYKAKPTTIDAEQWFSGKHVRGVYEFDNCAYVITIHDQPVYIEPGDYIIAEPDGIHFYPCKPAIFEAKYELITLPTIPL